MEAPPVVVHGQANTPVELPLRQPPATGYAWQLELPAGVVRASDGPGQPGRLGDASGGALRAIAPAGRYRLTASLSRPWAPSEAIRTVVIDLVVD